MKTIRKPISILLFLAMLISVISVAPFSVFATGNTWDPNNGVYNISTEADLFAFKNSLETAQVAQNDYYDGVTVNLLNDIRISDGTTYYSPNYYDYDAQFNGTFNGNEHTISNINIVSSDAYITSFFPMLENATIKDLTLSDVTIENGYARTAAFAPATFGNVKITNCHINGDCLIKTKSDLSNSWTYTGGFVADQYNGNLEIRDCTVGEDVTIIGTNNYTNYHVAGGIVAYIRNRARNTLISNCVNRASVDSSYIASGIVGTVTSDTTYSYNSLTIDDCINYGNITASVNGNGTKRMAGILAESFSWSTVYIDRCANHGDITVNGSCASGSGGIAGEVAYCSIQNTYNTGTITALNSNTLGGIVGQFRTEQTGAPVYTGGTETIYFPEQFNSMVNCYNTGSVNGGNTNYVGGIAGIIQDSSSGAQHSIIENAYNFGSISGGANSGNACAEIQNTSLSNTFSPNGTQCIGENSGAAISTSHIGYFTSANTDGIIYPATMTTGQSEVISGTPLSDNLLKTLNNWVSDKNSELENGGNSYRYLTWKMTNPASEDGSKGVTVHPMFGVLIEQTVKFHTNNPTVENAAERNNQLFRVYNGDASTAEDTTEYSLNNGTVEAFYNIPAFAEDDYVFAGWYYNSSDGTSDGNTPFEFGEAIPSGVTDVYAHWIEVGEVNKDGDDDKVLPSSMNDKYKGFELFGTQIRPEDQFDENLGKIYDGGLRFVSSISESLLSSIDALSDETVNGNKVEYGYVTAATSIVGGVASAYGKNESNYKIQYKGENVNGINTNPAKDARNVNNNFTYVTNVDCTSQVEGYGGDSKVKYDHKNFTDYRLMTFVVNYTGNTAEADKVEDIVARAYLRYYDANGLLRTFYNDYGGTNIYGGCSVSYNTLSSLMVGGNIKTDVNKQ